MGEELDSEFKGLLRNKDIKNKPFMVFFTGVPFSSKSTLAKVIENRYDMVRVENDKIRGLKDEFDPGIDVYDYVTGLLKDWPFSNHRVFQDSSIDRMYEEIVPFCEKEEIPYYVISMPVPDDWALRAEQKGIENGEKWVLENKEKFISDHKEVSNNLEIDFRFGEDGGVIKLLKDIDRKIKKER